MSRISKITRDKVAMCIKIGTPMQSIRDNFKITEGDLISVLKFLGMYATPDAYIGSKNEAYFEGDFPPEKPKYSVKSLSKEEKEILFNTPAYSLKFTHAELE